VNDATGLVLFRVALTAGLTGTFNAWQAATDFTVVALGGVVAGAVFGYIVSLLLGRLQETHLNIVGGFLAAWASYICADALHVSGVLATVSCGLVTGWRQHDVFSASTRTQANAVWNVVVFALESLVFIFIGLSLRGVLGRLSAAGIETTSLVPEIIAIAAAMIISRFIWIFPAIYVPRLLVPGLRRRDPFPPVAVPVIMSWAGMRGVVSLAVALSVPDGFPGRDFILATTLAVILISILIQGTTLAPLICVLRLGGFKLERRPTLSEAATRVQVARAAIAAVKLRSASGDGGERHPRLVEQYGHRAEMAARFLEADGGLSADRIEHFATVLAANRASRAKVLHLHRTGRIHDSVLHAIEAELDLEEISAQRAMAESVPE
jgi:CPA1 family monovalent cation:H+ antiporter